MYGDDWEYADTRLSDTVVTHNGKPLHIMAITDRMTAVALCLVTGDDVEVNAIELDLTPVKLGYCNYNKKVFYVCRVPVRRYKQGLRRENMSCVSLTGLPSMLSYQYLVNTIMDVFPTFGKCLASVGNNRISSMAWHRDWAMDSNLDVYYRGNDRVGHVEGGVVVLGKQFTYLKEALSEVV